MATEIISVPYKEAVYVDSAIIYDGSTTISGIDLTNPIKVYASQSYTDGSQVYLYDIVGTTELNNGTFTISGTTANEFLLYNSDGNPVNGSGYTAYVSGGTVEYYTSTITGLSHLEGEMVYVAGEGTTQSGTVVSGSVTITTPVKYAAIGLPFTSHVQTMRFDLGNEAGSAIGKKKAIFQVATRMYRSTALKIGPTPTGTLDDMDFDGTTLYTGDKVETFRYGAKDEQTVTVVSELPYPFTILAIAPTQYTTPV